MLYEKYGKSIEDNVCSFCPYCTVFTFDSLDTLTPHCCLNVNGCVLFSGCGKHIHRYIYVQCLFFYFNEIDNVAILCVSEYSLAQHQPLFFFISLFVVHKFLWLHGLFSGGPDQICCIAGGPCSYIPCLKHLNASTA